jgi:hypothetical protein
VRRSEAAAQQLRSELTPPVRRTPGTFSAAAAK